MCWPWPSSPRTLSTRHYRVDEEVATKNNLAMALRLSGYFIAIILIFLGALWQTPTGGWASLSDISGVISGADGFGFNRELGEEVLRVFLYSLGGIVALNLVRVLFDRLILYKFQLEKEVVEDQNVGAGAAEFGMYVATGLLIAGSVSGDSNSLLVPPLGSYTGYGDLDAIVVTLAFFGMGLVMLIAFALFYEFTTPFNIHDEIERDNPAAGIALGGNLNSHRTGNVQGGVRLLLRLGGEHRVLPGFRGAGLCAALRDAAAGGLRAPAHGAGIPGHRQRAQHRRRPHRKRRGDKLRADPVHGYLTGFLTQRRKDAKGILANLKSLRLLRLCVERGLI